eukprot:TRINITY_DN16111_c0_g1_i1.p2 TRINITY_DN16111_c0_g1~~TRINITY_DN16111_c0_g1_i1.p2  ORF type:complete len:149 (-),score=39.92 TRINITY_DN16111_c0_g1_i1:78-524(-)
MSTVKACGKCAKTGIPLHTCGRCRKVSYCGKECQRGDWPIHKYSCREPARNEAEALADASTKHIEDHHREFREIIAKYGLDQGDRADVISDLLTNKEANEAVSVEDFAKKFGMTEREAYSFLAFIDVGIKYKEEHLNPNTEGFMNAMK